VRPLAGVVPVLALAIAVIAARADAAPAGPLPAAPPIVVTRLADGQKFDSRALLGKKILVVRFQASWCKLCAKEAAGLERVYEAYKERGVELLALHVQDTQADARAFLAAHHVYYPTGLDPQLRIANRFGVKGTPYTVVIDRGGKMVARIHGSADEARLRRILDPLLKPAAPKPPPKRLR